MYVISKQRTIHLQVEENRIYCRKGVNPATNKELSLWKEYKGNFEEEEIVLNGYTLCLSCQRSPLWKAKTQEEIENKYGYVYLLEAEGTGRYKIGCSKYTELRLYQLNQKQSPYPINLIHSFYCDDMYKMEILLKKAFVKYQVHNEWFELPPEAVDLIKYIKFKS